MKVIEPATEQVLAELQEATVEDADTAVARAKAAYPAWRAVTPKDRANLMRRIAAAIDAHSEELARLEARSRRRFQLLRGSARAALRQDHPGRRRR